MEKDPAKTAIHGETPSHQTASLAEMFNKISARENDALAGLREFQAWYAQLPTEKKPELFQSILHGMEVRKKDIEVQLHKLAELSDDDPIAWSRALGTLRERLESPRIATFRRFMNVPGGLKFLLEFRADLLDAKRRVSSDLDLLDADIAGLLDTWFQAGFLLLQEITQDSSYKHIRFLTQHDMVHPMSSIEEMGHRLGRDRRCFALFHHAMPEDIVIFIEVALTRGVARSIDEVIGTNADQSEAETRPNAAIFYSINNTQNGLAGLGLGTLLISQVVEAIKRDHPDVQTFATLSPIPGFRSRYLSRILQGDDDRFAMKKEGLLAHFSQNRRQALTNHYLELHTESVKNATVQAAHGETRDPSGKSAGDKTHSASQKDSGDETPDFAEVLSTILSDPAWIKDETYRSLLEKPLTELAYFHVAKEEKQPGKPLNPVANFHISNGARVYRRNIHFAANRTERGVMDSCGLMVYYVYSESHLQQFNRTVQTLLPWHK